MHFLIYGEDIFRSRKKLAALRDKFSAVRDASGLNLTTVCAEDGVDRAMQELLASPFLSEKRLVVLDGFLGLSEKEQERLGAVLEKKPDSTIAIFFESADAEEFKGSPLFPALAKAKFSERFPPLSTVQAADFVRDEATERGVRIAPGAVRVLVESCGVDTWRLHQEVAKLAAIAGAIHAPEIDERAVCESVSVEREEPIFALLDAFALRDAKAALKILHDISSGGTADGQIIALLASETRMLIAVRGLLDRGISDRGVIAQRVGAHPFRVAKAMGASRKWPSGALSVLLDRLLECDREMKSGGSPLALLELAALSLER